MSSRGCEYLLLMLIGSTAAVGAADTQSRKPMTEHIATARGAASSLCERSRADLAGAQGVTRIEAQIRVAASCECVPARLDAWQLSEVAKGSGTFDELSAQVTPLFAACATLAKRRYFPQWCSQAERAHAGILDVASYCRCMLDGLSRYSDAQLAEDAIATQRADATISQARNEGRSEPPRRESIETLLERRCRARDKPPRN